MRVLGGAAAALIVGVAGSCGGGPGEGRRYASLAEVGRHLGCDVQDVGTGGNEGLEAFGVCYVRQGDNVDIYLTSDRRLWEHLAEDFPSVLGPNWIVVCPTGGDVARLVHDELGGTLALPEASATPPETDPARSLCWQACAAGSPW